MNIKIVHLYPDLLNLYGDNGNLSALTYRLSKRGISSNVSECYRLDKPDFKDADIVFVGGGSDRELMGVNDNLAPYAKELKAYIEDGGTLLAVCGGYQLLGSHFECQGKKIKALELLDIFSTERKERFIGNIVCQSDLIGTSIVGFENHSAMMNIGSLSPLAKVVTGYGNDGTSGYEGVVHKNVIATFLHGPLLPKNPALTDFLLSKAIERKFGKTTLAPLDDEIELLAHNYAVQKFSK